MSAWFIEYLNRRTGEVTRRVVFAGHQDEAWRAVISAECFYDRKARIGDFGEMYMTKHPKEFIKQFTYGIRKD